MAALTVANPISPCNFGRNAGNEGNLHCGYHLQRCIQLNSLVEGKAIHARIIKLGLEIEVFLGNCLANMYAKCGNMKDARKMFDNMPEQNLVSWNVIIAGYAQQGLEEEALELFEEMQSAKMVPNEFTFGSVLKACATRKAFEEGKQAHCLIVKLGFEQNLFLGSALVDMYSKCGSIQDASQNFAKISQRNVVSWNAIIAAFIDHGRVKQALEFYAEMQLEGIKASHVTFGLVLNASASLGNLEHGKQFHACVYRNGFGSDLFVGSAVILMYMKCGSIDDARQVFDKMPKVDLGLFNATIQGYSSKGYNNEALKLFCELLRIGLKPNDITFTIVLRACASFEALEQGKQLHVQIIKSVFQHSVSVISSLITVYAKSGSIADAQKVFDKMTAKDNVVLWTAMIAGYSQKGCIDEALKLFLLMQRAGVKPNQFTYPTVLRACANLASMEEGKQVHANIIKTGVASDTFVASAIVDMYIKCGSLADGQRGFDRVPERDIVTWNTMIAGYAQHGYVKQALEIFEQMQQSGMKPDHVTFVAVLSACSRGGLVGLGRRYFNSLSRTHGIIPRMEHYACIVDLLGRVGRLYEAEDFISNMPFEPSALVWETLLQACRIHDNMELALEASECITKDAVKLFIFDRLSSMTSGASRGLASPRLMALSETSSQQPSSSKAMVDLMNSLQSLRLKKSSVPSWLQVQARMVNGGGGHGSPRALNLRHCVVQSRPCTLTHSENAEDVGEWLEEPVQRVESGKDLRARIYARLTRENLVQDCSSTVSRCGVGK